MLPYLAWRFRPIYGVAAGLFSLLNQEISLTLPWTFLCGAGWHPAGGLVIRLVLDRNHYGPIANQIANQPQLPTCQVEQDYKVVAANMKCVECQTPESTDYPNAKEQVTAAAVEMSKSIASTSTS